MIVYAAFRSTFAAGLSVSRTELGLLLLGMPVLHVAWLFATFQLCRLPALGLDRKDVVAATFCASQKTLAFGLPCIRTIFAGQAELGFYAAPIMVLHPTQILVGSLLMPYFQRYLMGGDDRKGGASEGSGEVV